MLRSGHLVIAIVGLALLVGLGIAMRAPHGSAIFDASVQGIGQVVDARTGEPVEGASVYVFHSATRSDAEEDLARLRAIAEEFAGPEQDCSTTDHEGASTSRCFGPTARLSAPLSQASARRPSMGRG